MALLFSETKNTDQILIPTTMKPYIMTKTKEMSKFLKSCKSAILFIY